MIVIYIIDTNDINMSNSDPTMEDSNEESNLLDTIIEEGKCHQLLEKMIPRQNLIHCPTTKIAPPRSIRHI